MRYLTHFIIIILLSFGPAMSYASVCCCMNGKDAKQNELSSMPCHGENTKVSSVKAEHNKSDNDLCPNCDCKMAGIVKIISTKEDVVYLSFTNGKHRLLLKESLVSGNLEKLFHPPKA